MASATSNDASAIPGWVTIHCTKATAEMARKTVMGARRRKTSGTVSAATNHRLGRAADCSTSQPELPTKRPAARATSTSMA